MMKTVLTAPPQQDLLRRQTMESAKRYKASWIELGRYLYAIYKDKHFKSWGYLTFEGYCMKELSMKQATAAKLLKSYFFLEKEEPRLVTRQFFEEETPKAVPDYESVNLLRLARESKKLSPGDYADLRDSVINAGKEPKEVRAQVKKLLEESSDHDPGEVKLQKRNSSIRRLITMLNLAKREFESENLLPGYLLKQMADLAGKLEDQIRD